MRIKDLKIIHENLNCNDDDLMDKFNESKAVYYERKESFEEALKNYDENNYAEFLVAKLYFEFAKESYNNILFEANRRRLIS